MQASWCSSASCHQGQPRPTPDQVPKAEDGESRPRMSRALGRGLGAEGSALLEGCTGGGGGGVGELGSVPPRRRRLLRPGLGTSTGGGAGGPATRWRCCPALVLAPGV